MRTCCLEGPAQGSCVWRHRLPPSEQQPRGLAQRPCMEPRSRNARSTDSSSGAHSVRGRSEGARMQTSSACSHLRSNPARAHSGKLGKGTVQMPALRLPPWRSPPPSLSHAWICYVGCMQVHASPAPSCPPRRLAASTQLSLDTAWLRPSALLSQQRQPSPSRLPECPAVRACGILPPASCPSEGRCWATAGVQSSEPRKLVQGHL